MNCKPILTNFQIQDVGQTFQIIIGLFCLHNSLVISNCALAIYYNEHSAKIVIVPPWVTSSIITGHNYQAYLR
jgi:hypothetical protein